MKRLLALVAALAALSGCATFQHAKRPASLYQAAQQITSSAGAVVARAAHRYGATFGATGGSEVGSFPNAAPLSGSERILADQNATTVNILPSQIAQYLGIPNGLSFPLSVANGGNGTATPGLVAGSNITITGSWPDQTIASTGGATPGGSSGSIQWNNGGVLAGLSVGAGQILQGGTTPTATSTPTLGASGTLGTLTFGNATSGLETVEPPTGALGTLTITLPGTSGTLALTSGNVATATALVTTPTTCSATQAATGILANGNATGCFTPSGSGTVTDGSGTTTANELLLSSTTAHAYTNATTLPTSALPALAGDVTSTAGSNSVTVSKVNGASVPASANCLSSNGGSQLTPGCPEPTVQETGTSYTVDSTWCGSLYVFTSASAVAISLPEITNCQIDFSEQGAGGLTITPSAGDINGSTSAVTVAQNRQITLNYDSTDTNWGAIGATALVAGGSGQPQDIQTFTTGGTWTKPAWASSDATATTKAICLGAGGGGGSGGVEPAGTAVSGGGGGGGGAWAILSFPTSSLSSTVSVTVGTAGTGGTAVAATGVGNNGGNGGSSSFGTYLTAYGGGFGQGGQNAAASSGGGGAGLISGGSGSTGGLVCSGDGASGGNGNNATCATGGAGGAGDSASGGGGSLGGGAFLAGGGGPSGGGLTSADATSSGGSSRSVGAAVGVAGGAAGSAGGAGNAPSAGAFSSGSPGAGGGSSATGNGGAGGASAIGSGGAGGGAAENGLGSSGAGGTGGSGECWVVTTY